MNDWRLAPILKSSFISSKDESLDTIKDLFARWDRRNERWSFENLDEIPEIAVSEKEMKAIRNKLNELLKNEQMYLSLTASSSFGNEKV